MSLDEEALVEYVALGHTLDWKTLKKGKKFKPKHLKVPALAPKDDVTLDEIKEALDNYFLQFEGQKVAVFLSGGKDSRFVVEMCHRLNLDVTAITFGYSKRSREYIIARKVCSLLKIPHIFLYLDPKIYSLENVRETIMRAPDSPDCAPHFSHYFYEETLSQYDAVFTGEYITHSLREERFYQPSDNVERLLRTLSFDEVCKEGERRRVRKKIILQNSGKSLNEIALKKIVDTRFKWFDRTRDLFNFYCPILDENVINTMWAVPETGIVKKVMKKYNFKTYNLPCTRSPFPLWFPWIVHYGYKYIENFTKPVTSTLRSNLDMGDWCGHWDVYCKLITNLANKLRIERVLDFDFINKEVLKRKLFTARRNVDDAKSLEKLIKLSIWLEEMA